eukprot:scaffold91170_cov23-Cyclotella_meneghiniana.AAC.1
MDSTARAVPSCFLEYSCCAWLLGGGFVMKNASKQGLQSSVQCPLHLLEGGGGSRHGYQGPVVDSVREIDRLGSSWPIPL